MRKKVDERIRTLIENGVKTKHRSMLFIIGDKYHNQLVSLHHLHSKALVKARPSVLWCYKNKLDISSHKGKRAKQLKLNMQRGLVDPEKVDSFSLFLESAGITYCMYKDSERVLGNTFGMCILQDFEALRPNYLARTIETVEGGGLIIILLHSLSSLTSLCTMVMDVHERFRTESHSEAAGRFNERFLLSIASCRACVVMDDELNILPISSHIRSLSPVQVKEDSDGLSEAERDLKNLKEELNEDFPVGPLTKMCCTLDQGKAVITFLDAILDKTLRSTVALLAARGRGKSAALGLAVAGAVAAGYSNIFITAPSPENLKTLFEFVRKGFGSLDYKEHIDYDVVKSSNPEYKKAIVRINIYKQHRQTIQWYTLPVYNRFYRSNYDRCFSQHVEEDQKRLWRHVPQHVVRSNGYNSTCRTGCKKYIHPYEHEKLSQVELLVVDEAAAIPLPVVKSLLGSYLVFISSTVNGYEGTGRSLSLKLLQQLEEQSQISKNVDSSLSGRIFKKIELSESIRYASGDPIESWLNGLLCLDAANYIPNIARLPPPKECDLYYVNRDTLFSYHKDSELFLQRMMALYVASHYKNSPDDLQLMADASAHHLFVLLGPVDESKNHLPDILCVIQVCLEGQISRKSAIRSLSHGRSPHGDQIPWKFCEQFRDTVFPSLSGARIVRIATHPNAMRLGYGSVAVELLTRYFEGHLTSISESEDELNVDEAPVSIIEAAQKISLLEENIKPRANLPPLLVHLRERRAEKLHYLAVSFGLTLDLFRFWRKHKFVPFYIGSIPNAVTGEHTCMVLKALHNDDIEADTSDEFGFVGPFYRDFKRRFRRLLGSTFRSMEYKLAMSVLDPKINFADSEIADSDLERFLMFVKECISPHDMKRLQAYTDNLADFRLISDIIPILSHLYFEERIPVSISLAQASVLLCIGLQNQDISYTEGQMKLEGQQILSLFIKVMKKFHKYLYGIASKDIESTLPRLKEIAMKPHDITVDEDLENAANQVKEDMKAKSEALLDPELLQQFAVEADSEKALKSGGVKLSASGLISVKSSKGKPEKQSKVSGSKNEKKRSKDERGNKSSKKRKS